MKTRSELVAKEVAAIKVELEMVKLRRLATASASAFERADAALSRELRAMIASGKE
jgi:hypothetical protein